MPRHAYPNQPCVGVGAVVFKDDCVLLVQRGQAPSNGLWAIPGGSVELGETLTNAVEREILEETGIKIRAKHPIYTFDHIEKDSDGKIFFHYVIIDFLADYVSGIPRSGDDALQAQWISSAKFDTIPVNHQTRYLLKSILKWHSI